MAWIIALVGWAIIVAILNKAANDASRARGQRLWRRDHSARCPVMLDDVFAGEMPEVNAETARRVREELSATFGIPRDAIHPLMTFADLTRLGDPPVMNDVRFLARMPADVSPHVALTVREALVEASGVDEDEILPDTRLLDILD